MNYIQGTAEWHGGDDTKEGDDREWIQTLLDMEIPATLSPDQRLLLAILRQSVLDYFGDDPTMRIDAGLYFARSWVYRLTLQLFNLPDDLLPRGVDLTDFRRKEKMNENYESDPMKLETLVRRLSGNQLKIMLSMGLLSLPAVTRQISLKSGISRSTALGALVQMDELGLVVQHQIDGRAAWSLPDAARKLVDEVWRS